MYETMPEANPLIDIWKVFFKPGINVANDSQGLTDSLKLENKC